MDNEIVPVLEGSPKDANALPCYSPCDLLDGAKSTGSNVELIGGNHQIRHFLSPDKGQKYVTRFSPTPASVKPLLDKMKEPSMLWLRGCESLLRADFPFAKFNSLTALEISGCTHLTTFPAKQISQMTHLQSLNLSHLPITQLPADDLFSELTSLHSLVLRGCFNLRSLPNFPRMNALQSLHLSDLLIERLPEDFFAHFQELRWLVLRGCSKLGSLPSIYELKNLEVFDLSHCTTLIHGEYMGSAFLELLDLSYIALPTFTLYVTDAERLTHLYLRETNYKRVFIHAPNLKVLDLSGSRLHGYLFMFRDSRDLVALDLSRGDIESIDFLSEFIHLRNLIVRECNVLKQLPEMKDLIDLEVLDISGCERLVDLPEDLNQLRNLKELNLSGCSCLKELREGLFDAMTCLEKLDLSKTNITNLPSLVNLTNLQTLNLSHTPIEKVAGLSDLINLKDFVHHHLSQNLTNLDTLDLFPLESHDSSGVGNLHPHPHHLQEKVVSNLDEFHLVSTFMSDSGFDRFRYEFKNLEDLISNIEKNISPVACSLTSTNFNMMSESFKRNFGSTRADLKYILKNIDLLESSSNCTSGEELLLELMEAATCLCDDDFSLHSSNLNALLRVVAKLKLLVPPHPPSPPAPPAPPYIAVDDDEDEIEEEIEVLEEKNDKKKKKPRFTTSKDEVVTDVVLSPREIQDLSSTYESLTDLQQKCLLYLVLFPRVKVPRLSTVDLVLLKEKILIQLWYGEGFIDPDFDVNKDMSTTSIDVTLDKNDANGQVSTTNGVDNPNTMEEIGKQIFNVLEKNKLIERFGNGRIWYFQAHVQSFLKEQARQAGFFNFNDNNDKLTPHFRGSHRACLLKSLDHCPSSCQLWLNYTSSIEKIESFKKIHTLLYVNEPIIDIKTEWFSKMENLRVLHLVNLRWKNEDQVDIVDVKFLEALKNMKQLRLLSLEGFAAIIKLPDSVCKLANLKLLNLRYCSHLEELPAGIGSLENLTHLDLTQCHLLSELPKGIRLLSKLEVLKGFMITYVVGGRQHTKACTLRELLKLKKLRKLNLVVNRDQFPNSDDLLVFMEMNNLCNLKITWTKNNNSDQEEPKEVGQKASRNSRWQRLKCWEQRSPEKDTRQEPLRSNCSSNIKKLVLCCFPSEVAPNWLDPSELQKLEKLCITGGDLKIWPKAATDQYTWNVQTLHLRYLRNLGRIDTDVLRDIFPGMTELYKDGVQYI